MKSFSHLVKLQHNMKKLLKFAGFTNQMHAPTQSEPISGRVDKESVTEMVDLDLISGQIKPKTIKIVITYSLSDV